MDLLDTVAKKSGTIYLSSLKANLNWVDIINKIEPTDFPLEDWTEAAHYLCNTSINFKSAQEAKEYLKKYKG